jgi:hypothetical protein
MKKTAVILTLFVVVLALAAPGTVVAEEKSSKELERDAKRAKINEVSKETLEKLFSENPKAKGLYDEAVGWAVFDNTKVAFGVRAAEAPGLPCPKARASTSI